MNAKKAKAMRKLIRKNKQKILLDFIRTAREEKLISRLRLAWLIVKGQKKNN